MRVTAQRHRVEIAEYDPQWTTKFARERDRLRASLGDWLSGPIEHVGSTAVPGMPAKPVIDIMVPVRSLEHSRPAIPVLEQEHGYTYWPYKADVMHWLCKPSEYVRTHHVHLIPRDSALFRDRLFFRDSLRAEPELRDRYERLKRDLAARFSEDREAYTQAKAPFIMEVLGRQGGG